MKKLLTLILAILFLLIILALLVPLVSVYLKAPMYLSGYSSFFATQYATQFLLIGVLVFLICFLFYKFGKYSRVLLQLNVILSVVLLIGLFVFVVIILSAAKKYDAKVSVFNSMKGISKPMLPTETLVYFSKFGEEYKVDVYRPKNTKYWPTIPVVAVHGGAFIEGNKTQIGYAPAWFTKHGFTVFSIDYPLARDDRHTWEVAANTIATAMRFVEKNAHRFNIDPQKIVLIGGSAGAALIMQTDVGLREGYVRAYDSIQPKFPKAVIALYPPVDLSVLYQKMLDGKNIDLRYALKKYIGGYPSEYPKRYAQIDIVNHLATGTSPTLILAGEVDHVVNVEATRSFVNKAKELKLPVDYVEIPYGEHVFDANPNSIAGQIVWDKVGKFLNVFK